MRQTNTATFEIVVEGNEPPYVLTAMGPGLDQPIRASLADHDAWLTTELRNILDVMARERITGGELPPEAIQRLGRGLFEVLFGPDIAVALGAARAMQKDKGLRLRLQIVPPELSALPWETMHDANGWLSTRGDTPLVRRFPAPDGALYPPSLQVSPPLRVLFVGASPTDATPIDIEAIAARLRGEEVLGKLIASKKAAFDALLHPTPESLLDKLAENYHVVVFVCHGGFAETDGLKSPVIFLEDEDGAASALPAKGHLAEWLREKPTRLVLVAACNTAANPEATDVVLRSFAQELCEVVPAVIAMQYSVSDLVAPAFVEQYLQLLAAFRPVDVAMAEARQSLILPPYQARRDVFAPVMYLQTDDGALFRKARNWALYGLVALLPILILLASIAGYAMDQRRKTAAINDAQQLAAKSIAVRENSPQHSLLLAVEALKATGDLPREPAAEQALRDTLAWAQGTGGVYLGNNSDPYKRYQGRPVVAISTDSRWLAGFIGGELILRDLTQTPPISQTLSSLQPTDLIFSANSHWLAALNVNSQVGTIQLWQLTDTATVHCVLGPFDGKPQMIFGRTTSWLTTLDESGLRLWNPDTCEPLTTPLDQVYQLPVVLRGFANRDQWLIIWYPFLNKTSVVRLDICERPNCSPSWHLARDIDDATMTWLSPDGRWLATGGHFLGLGPPGKKTPVRLWDLGRDDLHPVELQCPSCKTDYFRAIEFSRNARWLTAVDSNAAYLWQNNSGSSDYAFDGKLLLSTREQEVMPEPVRFTDDERWLVVVGKAGKSARAWVWDLNSVDNRGRQGYQLSDPADSITNIETRPDSQWIAITGADRTLRLWSPTAPASDRQPVQIRIHGASIEKTLFSRDSKWLVTAGADGIWLWEVARLQSSIEPILLQDNVSWPDQPNTHLAVSPDGRWLFIGSDPWQSWLLDETGVRRVPANMDNPRPFSAVFVSGAKLFLTGPGGRVTRQDLGQNTYEEILSSRNLFATVFAVSSDGHWLIRDDDLSEMSSGTAPAELRPLQVGYPRAFSPDDRWLLASDLSGAAFVYDLSQRSFPLKPIPLEVPAADRISAWSFSADGHWLAIRESYGSKVRVWKLDGKHRAAAKICDRLSYYPIAAFALSPDGRRMATADSDGKLAIWSLKGQSRECAWEGTPTYPVGGSISKLAFSEDGLELFAVSTRSSSPNFDTTIHRWDIAEAHGLSDPVELLNLHFTYSGVPFYGTDLVVAPHNGGERWLALDSGSGEVYLVRLRLDDLVRLACQTAGRNFTGDEWNKYFPDRNYERTCDQWPADPSAVVTDISKAATTPSP